MFKRLGLFGGVDAIADIPHDLIEAGVFFHLLGDFVAAIHHGGVVFAAKHGTNFGQAEAGVLTHQVHADLAGEADFPLTRAAFELLFREVKHFGNDFEHGLRRDLNFFRWRWR